LIDKRPLVSILENSKILGEQNVAFLRQALEDECFMVHDFKTDAADFGSPCRRERQYLLIVDTCADEAHDMPAWTEGMKALFDEYHRSMRVGPGDPSEYILDAEHHLYKDWHSDMVQHREALMDKHSVAKRRKVVGVRTAVHTPLMCWDWDCG
jgi:hypothetical protein